MSKAVKTFFDAEKNLFDFFGCSEKYPVRSMRNCKWRTLEERGTYFLTCLENNNMKMDFVIVKKDGAPMVFEKKGYTMIIGIDCIKMAFVLDNENRME